MTALDSAAANGNATDGVGPQTLRHPRRHHTMASVTQTPDAVAVAPNARCFQNGIAAVATATAASIGK